MITLFLACTPSREVSKCDDLMFPKDCNLVTPFNDSEIANILLTVPDPLFVCTVDMFEKLVPIADRVIIHICDTGCGLGTFARLSNFWDLYEYEEGTLEFYRSKTPITWTQGNWTDAEGNIVPDPRSLYPNLGALPL